MMVHEHLDREIISNDRPIETKLIAQQTRQNGRATRTGKTINRGIRVHNRGNSCVSYDCRERFSVDFAQFPRSKLNRCPVASAFRHSIAKEVFAGCGYSVSKIV